MYIKKIELLNFQVIEKFQAEFDGNVYFITGDNELGKSTLLKAIGALLTGQRDDVLRNGASKGFAKMVVGDDGEEFDVSLSFTENNPRGTLTIKQKSTGMSTNNVTMLQRIFGYQDFDAVEFSRWSETAEGRRKQVAVVKALLPDAVRERLNTLESEIKALKDERTGIGRDVKTYAGFVETMERQLEPGDVDKYAKPIDVTELMEKQQTNARLIEKAKIVRAALEQRTHQLEVEIPDAIKAESERYGREDSDIDDRLLAAKKAYEKAVADAEQARKDNEEKHKSELNAIEIMRADFADRKANAEEWLRKYQESDPEKTDIPVLLANAKQHDKKHNMVLEYISKKAQYDAVKEKADAIESDIAAKTNEHAALIADSELPIDGLTFTDDGLELNGVPFVPGKVSDSQTMEIAAKLVIASNPTVKVFRIARGESLGAKRLQTIVDIAKRNGFQGFIEQVQRGQTEMMVEEYTEQ